MTRHCLLPDRSVFGISGPDAKNFLQDLTTNNLDLLSPTRVIYSCLLTPQGKFLFDFFLLQHEDMYLVDCDKAAAPQLLKRLMFYKLRAAVDLTAPDQSWSVGAVLDGEGNASPGTATEFCGGLRYQDPRLAAMGERFVVPSARAEEALRDLAGEPIEAGLYDQHRLALGVPSADDLVPEKTFPMEANLDLLHAIDFQKGCFVGQEVTSRTYRQGKVRKRILPINTAEKALPAAGTPVMAGDRQAGELLSARGSIGLALLRLDRLDGPLDVNGLDVDVRFPDWLPAADAADEGA